MAIKYLINIRNIPWTVSHCELEKYFSTFGDVRRAKIIFNKSGISTGYGFVEFCDISAMKVVLERPHILEKQELIVSINSSNYIKE